MLGSLLHTRGAGPFGPAAPLGGADGSGWVWAAAVLLAARLGRLTAQEARLDVRKLQVSRVSGLLVGVAGLCLLWHLGWLGSVQLAAARLCSCSSHTNASCFGLALSVPLLQFERERSRALSKDLLAARQRWQATEAERAASEDARR